MIESELKCNPLHSQITAALQNYLVGRLDLKLISKRHVFDEQANYFLAYLAWTNLCKIKFYLFNCISSLNCTKFKNQLASHQNSKLLEIILLLKLNLKTMYQTKTFTVISFLTNCFDVNNFNTSNTYGKF